MSKIEEISQLRNKKINKIEKIKNIKSIKDAFSDLKRYASLGYENISKEDLNYYFKCFGVFDKRKENGENSFMIRVRIPGGQLNATQAKILGEVSKKYGKNSLDLTTRMQVELRYISIENLPIILEKLDSVGISTYQTGIDNIRNILTDPLDGVSVDNVIESMPILKELQKIFFKQEEWIGKLPRKFNTAISGSLANRCNVLGHDCCFYLAKKDEEYGFNVALGSRVGVISQKADVFLRDSSEVVSFYAALIKIYKEYGFRDNRNKNRLYFFIKEIGMEALVAEIKKVANIDFLSAGEEVLKKEMFNPNNGSVKLKDGSYALHSVVNAGVCSGDAMIAASRVASEFGNKEIRITYEQNIFILGVSEENIKQCLSDEFFRIHKNIDTPYVNNLITCIGSKNCQYGIIETKGMAKELNKYLEQEIPLINKEIVRLYWSGCIKGCGLDNLGDLGFRGVKFKNEQKETILGVSLTLGGKMTHFSAEGRLLYKSLTIDEAKQKVKNIITIYLNEKETNETFESFDTRVLSILSIDDILEKVG